MNRVLLLNSKNGPILPKRNVNIDYSNANFNAIRNMNLLPPPSASTKAPYFDDNMSIRSAGTINSHSHFIPDSPLSIHSQPIHREANHNYTQNNIKSNKNQPFLSVHNAYRHRQIASANNTPMKRRQKKKKKRRLRSRSHTRSRASSSYASQRGDLSSNFKVVVRVRPPLQRELQSPLGFAYIVRVNEADKSIAISDGFGMEHSSHAMTNNWSHNVHNFTFDSVYPDSADQCRVYETTAKHSVLSALEGYNASIIAYGQTSAGKTYTMEGFESERLRGIIPRAIEDIFNFIESKASPTMRFLVRASYLQIYNDVISDLLKSDRTNLQIREDKKKGVYVANLSEWVVRSCEEIYGLIQRGAAVRATCATNLNAISSRSHAIFMIIVEQNEITPNGNGEAVNNIKIGKLNLVDLAGSERVRISGAEGQRLEESKNINQSLSALGNVISALTDSKRIRRHIPYRDSKLTRILEDSLGGNCKTTMMAMVSPALEHYSETVSTLKFANRAKNIQNVAVINQDLNEKALLRKYAKELKRLKAELAAKSENVVDKSKWIELQEQKNKAERDKMTAIQYLQKMSHDLEREKGEKQQLMKQMEEMNSRIVTNCDAMETTNHQDKAQVERYKELLLKQRDIMIQLTSRLNNRDQSILALQEELDAYDDQQTMMENVLDQKTVKLINNINNMEIETKSVHAAQSIPVVFNASNDEPMCGGDDYVNPFHATKQAAAAPSLEYLLRSRINDMVQKEVEMKLHQQEHQLEEWRCKYENAEERRRNSEYLLELSKVGGKANVLHEQLKLILHKERSKVEEKFHHKINELKQQLNSYQNKQTTNKTIDNKSVFAELKKLKNLHNQFSKMQQKTINQTEKETEKDITHILKNENLSDLVLDLKKLQNIENSVPQKREHLKQSIESRVRSLVENLTAQVINQQNGEAQTIINNEIIQAQQIINTSFALLN
eukprot:158409_1